MESDDEREPDFEDLEYAKKEVVAAAFAWRDMLSPKDAQSALGLLDASRRLEKALQQVELLRTAVEEKP